MAEVKLKLQSMGIETCDGCHKTFERGENMNGVEFSDGKPAGWYCDPCIQNWRKEAP